MLRPDDADLLEHAALALLATCRRQAASEDAALFRQAVNRLLDCRGAFVGCEHVDADILRATLREVTEAACDEFRAAMLDRLSDAEKAVVERELDRMFERIETAAVELFPRTPGTLH
jgi:hypothetical protein